MVISHNISAINAQRQSGIITRKGDGITEKLSSGYRVNRAADDAAGLSISEKMRKQIRGLDRAAQNAQDGISLVQTAEGALAEVHDMLQRMNELCVQAANGTNSGKDRQYIQDEIIQLKGEIDRISMTAKFNEVYLLNGTLGDPEKAGEARREYAAYMDEVDRKLSSDFGGAGNAVYLDGANGQTGLRIIYKELTHDVNTVQSGSGNPGLSGTSYDMLRDVLQKEIVPQAVKALIDTYPQAYGYLANSDIGIGMYIYQSNSSELASVTLGSRVWSDGTATPRAELTYKLSVNVNTLIDASTGAVNLTPAVRNELEVTIIHEMMHAMMDEVHTNGMLGFDGNKFSNGEEFPGWFKEGMAQTAAGGCFNGNDWVNGSGTGWLDGVSGLNITDTTSETDIANRVTGSGSRLSSGTTTSKYATGYLASMYLGYLANGGGAVTKDGIQKGLDKILAELRGSDTTKGKSLDSVIRDNTNYNGIRDFENKFGDAASASFIKDLVKLVGNMGTGGLVADFSSQGGILPDAPLPSWVGPFMPDPNNSDVVNQYPQGYPVMSGGSAYKDGTGVGVSGTGGTGGTGSTGGTGGTDGVPGGVLWKEVTLTGGLKLQVGAEYDERMTLFIEGISCSQIGIQDVDVSTEDSATRSIDMVAFALGRVSSQRSTLGAYQNRLESIVRNLDNVVENTQTSESKIRDTDMAEEMVRYSNNQILQQAGQSVLVQATQAANGVMKLLT